MLKKIIALCLTLSLCIGCATVLSACGSSESDKEFNVKNYAAEAEESDSERASYKTGSVTGQFETIDDGGILGSSRTQHNETETVPAYYTYEITNILSGKKLNSQTVYSWKKESYESFDYLVFKTDRELEKYTYVAYDGTVLANVNAGDGEYVDISSEYLTETEDDDEIKTKIYAVTVTVQNAETDKTTTNYYTAKVVDNIGYATVEKLANSVSAKQVYNDLAMPDVNVSTPIYQDADGESDRITGKAQAGSVETMYYQFHKNSSNDRYVFSFYSSKNGTASPTADRTLELSIVDEDYHYDVDTPFWFLGDYLFYQKYESKSIGRNYKNYKYTTYRYNILTGENEKIDTPFHITSLTTLASNDGKHELALAEGYAYVDGVAEDGQDAVVYILDSDLKLVQDFTFTDAGFRPNKKIQKLSDTRYLVGNYITDENLNPIVNLLKKEGTNNPTSEYTIYPEAQCILIKYKNNDDNTVDAIIDYDGNVLLDWNTLDSAKFSTLFDGRFIAQNKAFTTSGMNEDLQVFNADGKVEVESVRKKLNVTGNTELHFDTNNGWIYTSTKNDKTFSYKLNDNTKTLEYTTYTITIYNYKMEKLVSFESGNNEINTIKATANECWLQATVQTYKANESYKGYEDKTTYEIIHLSK